MMAGALQNWSPWRELDRFRDEFDELFDRFFRGRGIALPRAAEAWAPSVESYLEGDNFVVRADLPGIDPKDVEVTVTGDMLTLKGSRESKHEEKKRDYMYREVSYGGFERRLTLPEGVNADKVKASYHDGVLTLTMPAPKKLAAKKIPIQVEAKK